MPGPGIAITLAEIASHHPQSFSDLGTLNALGNDFHAEMPGQLDHRLHDRAGAFIGGHGADKIAINLDDIEGQHFQARQRGIAGPEIIKRERHSASRQPRHHTGGLIGVTHDLGFGNLELEGPGRQFRPAHGLKQSVGECGRNQFAHRRIGGHKKIIAARAHCSPQRQIGDRRSAHFGTDPVKQVEIIGHGEKVLRRQYTNAGALPARQRLEACQAPGLESDNGLVPGNDFAGGDAVGQRVFLANAQCALAAEPGRRHQPLESLLADPAAEQAGIGHAPGLTDQPDPQIEPVAAQCRVETGMIGRAEPGAERGPVEKLLLQAKGFKRAGKANLASTIEPDREGDSSGGAGTGLEVNRCHNRGSVLRSAKRS